MKKIFYIAVLLFFSSSIFGQNLLTNAVYSLKNKELDKAKELIDAASVDSVFYKKPATWYYKGFIYKDLFKRDEANDRNSQYREQSIEYFTKSLKMEADGPFAKGCKNSIKYFAQTFYNQSAVSFNPTDYPIAISSYDRHKELVFKVAR